MKKILILLAVLTLAGGLFAWDRDTTTEKPARVYKYAYENDDSYDVSEKDAELVDGDYWVQLKRISNYVYSVQGTPYFIKMHFSIDTKYATSLRYAILSIEEPFINLTFMENVKKLQ